MVVNNLYDLKQAIEQATKGMTVAQQKSMPVYLGDDEEINGTHQAWSCGYLKKEAYDTYYIKEGSPKVFLIA